MKTKEFRSYLLHPHSQRAKGKKFKCNAIKEWRYQLKYHFEGLYPLIDKLSKLSEISYNKATDTLTPSSDPKETAHSETLNQ